MKSYTIKKKKSLHKARKEIFNLEHLHIKYAELLH